MDKSKVDVSSADFKEPFLTQKARATEIKINPPLISSTRSLRLVIFEQSNNMPRYETALNDNTDTKRFSYLNHVLSTFFSNVTLVVVFRSGKRAILSKTRS